MGNPVDDIADADAPPRGIEWRARALLALLALLLMAATLYLMYARGVFEPTQRLILVTDDAEGVTVGMDLTFSGFAIGRVRRIGLADDGSVRIEVDVPRRDARWLREVSVFTLERGLVGGTKLRAFTGSMDSPPLPDGAVRAVLRGDALADLPRVVNTARELVEQLKAMTGPDAPVNASLRELRELLARANGPGGALQAALGEQDRRRVTALLDDSRGVLAGVQGVLQRVEATLQRTEERLLAPQGVAEDAQAALREARALLVDLRGSLKRIDSVVEEAHGVARNVRAASVDLDALRAEVEVTLRRAEALMLDVQRRWPFARDVEIPLP